MQDDSATQKPKPKWEDFRMNGIRPAKSIVSSLADITGDWWFYLTVRGGIGGYRGYGFGPNYDKYELPLLVFAILSTVMGVLLAISMSLNLKEQRKGADAKSKAPEKRTKIDKFDRAVKTMLGLEILVEDIPQFILTAMITLQRGGITPTGVFNVTTSGMNFVMNALDLIEIEREDDTNEDATDRGCLW